MGLLYQLAVARCSYSACRNVRVSSFSLVDAKADYVFETSRVRTSTSRSSDLLSIASMAHHGLFW